MVEETIQLAFKEGSSDKIYQAELMVKSDGWHVEFAYGRRNAALIYGTKTKKGIAFDVAKITYDKLVKSKVKKGYTVDGTVTSIVGLTKADDLGVRPQLLNELTKENAMHLIRDPAYCMQEKFDGRRRMLIRNEDESIQGANKKGNAVSLSKDIADACESIEGPYILDGEDMGDKVMLFDDITKPNLSYRERYQALCTLTQDASDNLEVVKTAWNANTKSIMWTRLQRERAEGVVFKLIDAPYTAGRPASGGTQLKCKFYDTASCIVESVSSVKNSIGLRVFDDSHPISLVGVSVGNATLYPNSPKVEVGDIVEIKYLYYNEGGSLYQPVLKEVRDDVEPHECTLAKLKRKKDE